MPEHDPDTQQWDEGVDDAAAKGVDPVLDAKVAHAWNIVYEAIRKRQQAKVAAKTGEAGGGARIRKTRSKRHKRKSYRKKKSIKKKKRNKTKRKSRKGNYHARGRHNTPRPKQGLLTLLGI